MSNNNNKRPREEDEPFLCSHCHQHFEDPRILPCGHSFCYACLVRHQNALGQIAKCLNPNCSSVERNVTFKPNIALRDALTYFKRMRPTAEDAEYHCSEHNQPLTMVCAECDVAICDDCPETTHLHSNSSSIKTFADLAEPIRVRFEAQIQALESQLTKLNGFLRDPTSPNPRLDSARAYQAYMTDTLCLEAETLKGRLNGRLNSLTAELNDQFTPYLKKLEDASVLSERLSSCLETCKQIVEDDRVLGLKRDLVLQPGEVLLRECATSFIAQPPLCLQLLPDCVTGDALDQLAFGTWTHELPSNSQTDDQLLLDYLKDLEFVVRLPDPETSQTFKRVKRLNSKVSELDRVEALMQLMRGSACQRYPLDALLGFTALTRSELVIRSMMDMLKGNNRLGRSTAARHLCAIVEDGVPPEPITLKFELCRALLANGLDDDIYTQCVAKFLHALADPSMNSTTTILTYGFVPSTVRLVLSSDHDMTLFYCGIILTRFCREPDLLTTLYSEDPQARACMKLLSANMRDTIDTSFSCLESLCSVPAHLKTLRMPTLISSLCRFFQDFMFEEALKSLRILKMLVADPAVVLDRDEALEALLLTFEHEHYATFPRTATAELIELIELGAAPTSSLHVKVVCLLFYHAQHAVELETAPKDPPARPDFSEAEQMLKSLAAILNVHPSGGEHFRNREQLSNLLHFNCYQRPSLEASKTAIIVSVFPLFNDPQTPEDIELNSMLRNHSSDAVKNALHQNGSFFDPARSAQVLLDALRATPTSLTSQRSSVAALATLLNTKDCHWIANLSSGFCTTLIELLLIDDVVLQTSVCQCLSVLLSSPILCTEFVNSTGLQALYTFVVSAMSPPSDTMSPEAASTPTASGSRRRPSTVSGLNDLSVQFTVKTPYQTALVDAVEIMFRLATMDKYRDAVLPNARVCDMLAMLLKCDDLRLKNDALRLLSILPVNKCITRLNPISLCAVLCTALSNPTCQVKLEVIRLARSLAKLLPKPAEKESTKDNKVEGSLGTLFDLLVSLLFHGNQKEQETALEAVMVFCETESFALHIAASTSEDDMAKLLENPEFERIRTTMLVNFVSMKCICSTPDIAKSAKRIVRFMQHGDFLIQQNAVCVFPVVHNAMPTEQAAILREHFKQLNGLQCTVDILNSANQDAKQFCAIIIQLFYEDPEAIYQVNGIPALFTCLKSEVHGKELITNALESLIPSTPLSQNTNTTSTTTPTPTPRLTVTPAFIDHAQQIKLMECLLDLLLSSPSDSVLALHMIAELVKINDHFKTDFLNCTIGELHGGVEILKNSFAYRERLQEAPELFLELMMLSMDHGVPSVFLEVKNPKLMLTALSLSKIQQFPNLHLNKRYVKYLHGLIFSAETTEDNKIRALEAFDALLAVDLEWVLACKETASFYDPLIELMKMVSCSYSYLALRCLARITGASSKSPLPVQPWGGVVEPLVNKLAHPASTNDERNSAMQVLLNLQHCPELGRSQLQRSIINCNVLTAAPVNGNVQPDTIQLDLTLYTQLLCVVASKSHKKEDFAQAGGVKRLFDLLTQKGSSVRNQERLLSELEMLADLPACRGEMNGMVKQLFMFLRTPAVDSVVAHKSVSIILRLVSNSDSAGKSLGSVQKEHIFGLLLSILKAAGWDSYVKLKSVSCLNLLITLQNFDKFADKTILSSLMDLFRVDAYEETKDALELLKNVSQRVGFEQHFINVPFTAALAAVMQSSQVGVAQRISAAKCIENICAIDQFRTTFLASQGAHAIASLIESASAEERQQAVKSLYSLLKHMKSSSPDLDAAHCFAVLHPMLHLAIPDRYAVLSSTLLYKLYKLALSEDESNVLMKSCFALLELPEEETGFSSSEYVMLVQAISDINKTIKPLPSNPMFAPALVILTKLMGNNLANSELCDEIAVLLVRLGSLNDSFARALRAQDVHVILENATPSAKIQLLKEFLEKQNELFF